MELNKGGVGGGVGLTLVARIKRQFVWIQGLSGGC